MNDKWKEFVNKHATTDAKLLEGRMDDPERLAKLRELEPEDESASRDYFRDLVRGGGPVGEYLNDAIITPLLEKIPQDMRDEISVNVSSRAVEVNYDPDNISHLPPHSRPIDSERMRLYISLYSSELSISLGGRRWNGFRYENVAWIVEEQEDIPSTVSAAVKKFIDMSENIHYKGDDDEPIWENNDRSIGGSGSPDDLWGRTYPEGSPFWAVQQAIKGGSSEELRDLASEHPAAALVYAQIFGPDEKTQRAVRGTRWEDEYPPFEGQLQESSWEAFCNKHKATRAECLRAEKQYLMEGRYSDDPERLAKLAQMGDARAREEQEREARRSNNLYEVYRTYEVQDYAGRVYTLDEFREVKIASLRELPEILRGFSQTENYSWENRQYGAFHSDWQQDEEQDPEDVYEEQLRAHVQVVRSDGEPLNPKEIKEIEQVMGITSKQNLQESSHQFFDSIRRLINAEALRTEKTLHEIRYRDDPERLAKLSSMGDKKSEQELTIEKIRTGELESLEPEEAYRKALRDGKPSFYTRYWAIKDPQYAYRYARYVDGGPDDETRKAASRDPEYAGLYAFFIDDEGPHDVTREGASRYPKYAGLYAYYIDEGPHDVTRAGASRDPKIAFEYALTVDEGPHDVTRAGASRDPKFASLYSQKFGDDGETSLQEARYDQERLEKLVAMGDTKAKKEQEREARRSNNLKDPSPKEALETAIENDGTDELRRMASRDPEHAYLYAFHIDKGPHDVTRAGASRDPEIAYLYAVYVDRGPHDVTRAGASRDPENAFRYARYVDKVPDDVTREGASRDPEIASLYSQKFGDDGETSLQEARYDQERLAKLAQMGNVKTRDLEIKYYNYFKDSFPESLKKDGVLNEGREETPTDIFYELVGEGRENEAPDEMLAYVIQDERADYELIEFAVEEAASRGREDIVSMAYDVMQDEGEDVPRWFAEKHNDLLPEEALKAAIENDGTDELRRIASQDPKYAGLYATDVDRGPHPVTRAGASRDPEHAYLYADDVDRGPHPVTRAGALRDPEHAYLYADYVDRGPDDETRKAASRDPEYAYRYARYVDKGPDDVTREGASRDPEYAGLYAYLYAEYVDKGPDDVTREGASRDPEHAYLYAFHIDKGPHDVTRAGASRDPKFASLYSQKFGDDGETSLQEARYDQERLEKLVAMGNVKTRDLEMKYYNYFKDSFPESLKKYGVLNEGHEETPTDIFYELAGEGREDEAPDEMLVYVIQDEGADYELVEFAVEEAASRGREDIVSMAYDVMQDEGEDVPRWFAEKHNDPSPKEALETAIENDGTDELRRIASQNPKYAGLYATDVDGGPHPVTRKGALQDPEHAYLYADYVDRGPDDETRKGASRDPKYAYKYARYVDKVPGDVTREGASRDPKYAGLYAYYIDEGPHPVTRAGASRDPKFAFRYALNVDEGPHDVTRKGASRDPEYAFRYALNVDEGPHDVTRKGASRDPKYASLYSQEFGDDGETSLQEARYDQERLEKLVAMGNAKTRDLEIPYDNMLAESRMNDLERLERLVRGGLFEGFELE